MHLKRTLTLAAAVVFGAALAHAGLIIDPTFDPSIATDPNAGSIEGAINAAIGTLEADITNSITVNIYFTEMSGGLGESETTNYDVSYYSYYNALKIADVSAAQLTALASLGPAPTFFSPGNPVNGNTNVQITSADGRALGFNTLGEVNGNYDSEVSLNTSITSPPNSLAGYYGLESVAQHEIDEALGIGGDGSTLASGTTGPVGSLDLYRYSAPGVRSYSTTQTTSPYSYFSIDGGVSVVSYFNQTTGDDYGDWLSNPIPAGFQPQVQDAFGQPGTDPTLGVSELTAFSVIGYDLAAPEPSTLPLAGLALAGFAFVRRRRHGERNDGHR